MGGLIASARQAVRGDGPACGLEPLRGGLTHDVFKADDGGQRVVIKVYRSWQRGEPDREWQALWALTELGLAPRPVFFSPAVGTEPPVIVMGLVAGQSRDAAEIGVEDLAAVVTAHRALHRLPVNTTHQPQADPLTVLGRIREMMSSWDAVATHLREQPRDVHAAGTAVQRWLRDDDPDLFAGDPPLVFGRGDPNLTNYLWVEQLVTMIDFEEAGTTDPAFELADMFEHANSRALSPDYWPVLCDLYNLDGPGLLRARAGRKLTACFWLAVLHRRARRGAEPVNLTLVDQAARVLELLG
jgi:aminoglycoside phosphotransferase (APT) family kinase protein